MFVMALQSVGCHASPNHKLGDAAPVITMNGVIEALHIYDDNKYGPLFYQVSICPS